MSITTEEITIWLGIFGILFTWIKFLSSRFDITIVKLRDEFKENNNEIKVSIKVIHERINKLNSILVNKEDIKELMVYIRELKVDITNRIDEIRN